MSASLVIMSTVSMVQQPCFSWITRANSSIFQASSKSPSSSSTWSPSPSPSPSPSSSSAGSSSVNRNTNKSIVNAHSKHPQICGLYKAKPTSLQHLLLIKGSTDSSSLAWLHIADEHLLKYLMIDGENLFLLRLQGMMGLPHSPLVQLCHQEDLIQTELCQTMPSHTYSMLLHTQVLTRHNVAPCNQSNTCQIIGMHSPSIKDGIWA